MRRARLSVALRGLCLASEVFALCYRAAAGYETRFWPDATFATTDEMAHPFGRSAWAKPSPTRPNPAPVMSTARPG
jgi:hypothetical protein